MTVQASDFLVNQHVTTMWFNAEAHFGSGTFHHETLIKLEIEKAPKGSDK